MPGRMLTLGSVVILVLMEDALKEAQKDVKADLERGRNPCFNGRCTQRALAKIKARASQES